MILRPDFNLIFRLPEVIFPPFRIGAGWVVFSYEKQEKGLIWYANYQIKPFYSAAISDTADQFIKSGYHNVVI